MRKPDSAAKSAAGVSAAKASRFVWLVVAAAIVFAPLGLWIGSHRTTDERESATAVSGSQTADSSNTSGFQDDGSPSLLSVPIALKKSWQELDNPAADGWATEAFHEEVKEQLKKLGEFLLEPQELDVERLSALLASDFSCDELAPEPIRKVFEDQAVIVERSASEKLPFDADADNQIHREGPLRGPHGLAGAISHAFSVFGDAEESWYEFKVYRVRRLPDAFMTRQYLSVAGQVDSSVIEQHATWVAVWTLGDGGSTPKLKWIGVEDWEQVRTVKNLGPLFSDCTEAVLAHNSSWHDQLVYGVNHWLERTPERTMLNRLGTPGVTIGDVNGDGRDDLYLCQESGLPNRLFLQGPDGRLQDVSMEWGVDWLEDSRSALLVDLDNDGDQDLVVAVLGNVVLASNEQHRRYQIREVLSVDEATTSLSSVDYDLDGRLDLYVCTNAANEHLKQTEAVPIGDFRNFVYHDANNGGANSLFHNETDNPGDWRFAEVTEEVGLDVNNSRWSLAASWDDFDNDGDQDLYVANDFGRNNLYRNEMVNQHRKFVDVAPDAGAEDSASGMSVSWGDYDRDGWMDVYVGNMFSAAGNRIMFQQKFKPGATNMLRRAYQRFARGNTLFRNLGKPAEPGFADMSIQAGLTLGRWAWSSSFFDFNNDGWDDLVVANGYMTTEGTGDL